MLTSQIIQAAPNSFTGQRLAGPQELVGLSAQPFQEPWRVRFRASLCGRCGGPLDGTADSRVLTCANCHSAWSFADQGLAAVDWQIVPGDPLDKSIVIKPLEPTIAPDMYVATLSDDRSQPIAVISSDVKNRQILLRFVNKPALAADKSLELWSISKEGKIRSLGLVSDTSDQGVLRISLPPEVNNDTPQLLAISLEPKGGSSDKEKPSGPILFRGNWLKTV